MRAGCSTLCYPAPARIYRQTLTGEIRRSRLPASGNGDVELSVLPSFLVLSPLGQVWNNHAKLGAIPFCLPMAAWNCRGSCTAGVRWRGCADFIYVDCGSRAGDRQAEGSESRRYFNASGVLEGRQVIRQLSLIGSLHESFP